MSARTACLLSLIVLCGAGFSSAFFSRKGSPSGLGYRVYAAEPEPTPLKSQVVSWDDAQSQQADWGQMRTYFRGQTQGTKDVLAAVAVVEPGKAVHRAHRHAQEEYLVLVAGSGTWSLAGKEFPARRGDILYAEPWVYHGLTNTGDEQLIFVVVRFNPKGVKIPPRPDSRADEL